MQDSNEAALALLVAAIEYGRSATHKFTWRRDPDLYSTIVAEVLLQNTPAERAEPIFDTLTARWRTFEELADASVSEIEGLLRPLGLFRRRADALTTLAKAVTGAEEHDRHDVGFLRELSGVGPYTAGIVAAIADQKTAPFVDGPLARLLCRYFDMPQSRRPSSDPAVWTLAGDLLSLPTGSYRERAWGLIDLGREICRATPRCPDCPVASHCLFLKRERPS